MLKYTLKSAFPYSCIKNIIWVKRLSRFFSDPLAFNGARSEVRRNFPGRCLSHRNGTLAKRKAWNALDLSMFVSVIWLGMVYVYHPKRKKGDDWGNVYDCFTHTISVWYQFISLLLDHSWYYIHLLLCIVYVYTRIYTPFVDKTCVGIYTCICTTYLNIFVLHMLCKCVHCVYICNLMYIDVHVCILYIYTHYYMHYMKLRHGLYCSLRGPAESFSFLPVMVIAPQKFALLFAFGSMTMCPGDAGYEDVWCNQLFDQILTKYPRKNTDDYR